MRALDFLLLALVTVLAAFISNFGNGFIYGLSAKFIDWKIAEEHRYTAYNLWCFVGDLGGYAGQGALSVWLADQVCEGHHYTFVCNESVAKSRQAALERTLQRQAEEQAAKEELQQRDALRLKKERCFQARCDLIRAVNVAHEDDALQCLEEMHGHIDMLVATDEYGSTLLHEACSRGMFRLAMAVLDATTEEQERLFQTDYRGQTPLHRAATAGSGEICAALCKLPLCQKSLKDQDGFTALKIAQRWGFSAAADAIFRLTLQLPPPEALLPSHSAMASSWSADGCCSGHAACTSLADLQSCLVQFKTELLQFRELRLRRQSSFRNFLEEAAVVTGEKSQEVKTRRSQRPGAADAEAVAAEDSDETDPGMPELQPVTPRPIAEVPATSHLDLCPSDGDSPDSPPRLGLTEGGDFNKCWGRSALKDALKGMDSSSIVFGFGAINPMPELQVLAPPEPDIEETPVEKPTKGKLKPGKRGGSKEKRSSVATSTASSRKDLRSSVSRGSSKGFSRQVSARSSLKEEGRSVSRGSSQAGPCENSGKRGSLLRAQGQDRRTSGGASGRTSRMSSRQSSRQSSIQASRPASQHSGEDGRGSRKNSQDFEDQSNAEGLSDAEGSTGEPTSPEASQAENPEEDGLNSGSEEERPPPLPEDIGYQAGFKAVEENRLENALALARSSLWPFTNEVNPRGWTLLHVAAYHGLEELCAMMCQRKDFKGIDKPEKDFYATALHFAAGKRRPGCCNAIVQSGRCLDVNAKDNKGQTALHLAALRADRESYAAIAAHPDCNPLLPDNQGKSAAEYAADRGLEVDCQVPGHTEIDF
eukprot:symbB.v1.2.022659.t1/scaffold2021.1/size93746/1